jgi:hypothetical protein
VDTNRRAAQGFYTENDLWIVNLVQIEKFPNINNKCLACGSKEHIKVCGQCKAVGFCSVSCQKQVWKHHKDVCIADENFRKQKEAIAVDFEGK